MNTGYQLDPNKDYNNLVANITSNAGLSGSKLEPRAYLEEDPFNEATALLQQTGIEVTFSSSYKKGKKQKFVLGHGHFGKLMLAYDIDEKEFVGVKKIKNNVKNINAIANSKALPAFQNMQYQFNKSTDCETAFANLKHSNERQKQAQPIQLPPEQDTHYSRLIDYQGKDENCRLQSRNQRN